MLKLDKYTVSVENKVVLDNISLDFALGKNYCILGKNGSWKSSLAMSIMGHPKYENMAGEIVLSDDASFINADTLECLKHKEIEDLNHIDIIQLDVTLRAKLGIFVAFQSIPEIVGVKLFEFLRTIYNAKRSSNETFLSFKKIVEPLCEELSIPRDFLWRDVNVGFSGWERRKIEILQLKLLKPRYVFLDEVDSGLDVDAFRSVAKLLADYNAHDNCLIIITHYFEILEWIPVDHVYMLSDGRLVEQWDMALIKRVKEHGFDDGVDKL